MHAASLLYSLYLIRHVTRLWKYCVTRYIKVLKGWGNRGNVWQCSQQQNVEIYIYTVEVYLFKLACLVVVATRVRVQILNILYENKS